MRPGRKAARPKPHPGPAPAGGVHESRDESAPGKFLFDAGDHHPVWNRFAGPVGDNGFNRFGIDIGEPFEIAFRMAARNAADALSGGDRTGRLAWT